MIGFPSAITGDSPKRDRNERRFQDKQMKKYYLEKELFWAYTTFL